MVLRPCLRPIRHRNDVEQAEDPEIAPVGGRDSLDTGAVIIRGKQGIENTFAAQSMPLHPVDKQRERVLRWLDDAAFSRLPPLAADLQRFFHRKMVVRIVLDRSRHA